MTSDDNAPQKGGLKAVAEDATGFGAGEALMTRDLILRPRTVAMAQGDPASPYPRAVRYLLTISGLFLAVMALLGGYQSAFSQMPASFLEPLAAHAGKSRDALVADLDQWFAFIVVPVVNFALFVPLKYLVGRWRGRQGAGGQALVFLSGWMLYGAPFTIAAMVLTPLKAVSGWLSLIIIVVLFVRIGRGNWWSRPGQAVWRFVQMAVLMILAYIPAVAVVAAVAVGGAVFGP